MTNKERIKNSHKLAIEQSTINGRIRPLPCEVRAMEVTIDELKSFHAFSNRMCGIDIDTDTLIEMYLTQTK